MSEILRFENVSFAYEGGGDALKDCNISINSGERIAVIGNNGAGKSTFFLLANGVLKPASGSIYFHGSAVEHKKKSLSELRKGVGLVFQDPEVMLLAGTVEEEISFGPINLGLDMTEVEKRVNDSMEKLHLEVLRQRAPQYLSGGEKKRVSIADVLAMEPSLIMLDEPAASLDPANTRLLEENLMMLEKRGIALMVANHDVNFTWRWARRVLVFNSGHILADATPEEVFGDAKLLEKCNLEMPVLYELCSKMGVEPVKTVDEFLEKYR